MSTPADRTGRGAARRQTGLAAVLAVGVALMPKLLADFRTGYVLTYIPTGVSRGGWHEIRVQSKNPAYTIRARDGYDGGR